MKLNGRTLKNSPNKKTSALQPLQVGAHSASGKIRNEKFHFCFKTLSKWVFSTFSIFPTSSDAYFYGIFDQKLISSIFSDIFGFKVEWFDQKVVAVICRGLVEPGRRLVTGSKNNISSSKIALKLTIVVRTCQNAVHYAIVQRISEIGGPQIANSMKKGQVLPHFHFIVDLEGLESSERAETIINRKIIIFCIETGLNFFCNSEKYFFWDRLKK